ncbi:hypothetical protein ILYODFUR_035368 [Ilyodon furcidens]|uniref:Uncharacterized protein n=1 Tax=Ilyodon furcidens TaxID=33524 RepID=A0ABV0UCS3_9TELE
MAERKEKGHICFLNYKQPGTVFNYILNQLITPKISCSDAQTFPPKHKTITMKQHVWFRNVLLVLKQTSACRRREQDRALFVFCLFTFLFSIYLFLSFHADYFNVTMSQNNINSSTAHYTDN